MLKNKPGLKLSFNLNVSKICTDDAFGGHKIGRNMLGMSQHIFI